MLNCQDSRHYNSLLGYRLNWLNLIIFFLIIGFSQKLSAASKESHFSFRHVLADQISGIGYINSINQDSLGFMWFGGANGLARYDGYELIIYRSDENNPLSINHNYVNDILPAENGDLWVATRGGLNYFDAKCLCFSHWKVPNQQDSNQSALDLLSIAKKDADSIWLGTRDGLSEFSKKRNEFTFHPIDIGGEKTGLLIWSIEEDGAGNLWLGTAQYGAIRFNPSAQTVSVYTNSDAEKFVDVRRVYRDPHNGIWLATYDSGLFKWNAVSDKFEKIIHAKNEKSKTVWAVIEDVSGNLWVGDGSAVYHRPLNGNTFTRFVYNEVNPRSPGNYVVNELFEDKTGNIWLGYFPSGIDVVDRQASVFRNYQHDSSNTNSVTDGGVLSSAKDSRENLWIGTGYGLNYFDTKKEIFSRIEFDPDNKEGLTGNTILSMSLDAQDNLWLGIMSAGLNKYHLPTKKFTHYLPDERNKNSLMGKEAWSVIVDKKGFVWVATEKGLNRLNPATGEFRHYLPKAEHMDGDKFLYSRVVYQDKKDQIWLGSIRGLYSVDPDTGDFVRYQHLKNDKKSLKNNNVFSIYEDSQNRFWIGTDGGGLNEMNRETGEFQTYTTAEGLSDDVVVGIIEGKKGFLWLGTQKGLSRFDPLEKNFRNFDKRHGLNDNLLNRNAPQLMQSGELFFGNSKGFVMFNPFAIETNPYVAPVIFTNLYVLNKKVLPNSNKEIIPVDISHAKTVYLSHQDTVFTLEFSSFNYQMPEENHYQYRLVGFDSLWINAGTRRSVTYTNLDPGTYVFEVKASNNDGVWGGEVSHIEIVVAPPWWATYWAYSFYILLLVLVCVFLWRVQKLRLNYEYRRLEQERSLVRRLQDVDKLKDEFLANTSHELRTPLNGIIGLAESLRDGVEGEVSENVRYSLGLIAASGKRLATLVDDILDFSKLKNKGLSLHKKIVDVSVLVDLVFSLIKPLLGDKTISMENLIPKDFPGVIADEDRLLQILYNLLGNAVKFTDQGSIRVSAKIAENNIAIYVQDTGIGIPENKLQEIFEAFQQVQGDVDRHHGGTGLGLTITKQLVELHGGILSVESMPKEGSTFCFTLPFVKNLPKEVDTEDRHFIRNISNLIQLERETLIKTGSFIPEKKLGAHILVVDDDALNRKVLMNYLSFRDYQVSEAGSGEDAIALIEEKANVDLVLLDIMMPRLSGYETCKRLRLAYPAHELPIIFLTARNQTQDMVMGFDVGGNDFLTKPIEKEELLARVATHLQLLDATRYLDKKVAERTQELAKTNEGLRLAQQRLHDAYVQIEEASLTDLLTGLHNRRFLTKSVVTDVAMVDRVYQDLLHSPQDIDALPDQDLAFLILDIDYFKEINDTYGHAAGDRVLEQISRVLEKNLRDSDYVIRWGGEEFLIVLRRCSRNEVADMAERIRRSVAETDFDIGESRLVKRTCSMGFAFYPFYCHAPDALTWEQVVDTADRALYIAKRSSRNCWVGIASTSDIHQTPINPATQTNLPVLFALNQLRVTSSLAREDLVVEAQNH